VVSYALGKDKEDTTEWGKVELYFQTVKQASFAQRGNAYGCCFTFLQKSNQSILAAVIKHLYMEDHGIPNYVRSVSG
jgi:hypothetical protein